MKLISTNELAYTLNISKSCIYKHFRGFQRSALLADAPAPVIRSRTKLLWSHDAVIAWLASKATPTTPNSQPTPTRGRGRPRKVAALKEGGAA